MSITLHCQTHAYLKEIKNIPFRFESQMIPRCFNDVPPLRFIRVDVACLYEQVRKIGEEMKWAV